MKSKRLWAILMAAAVMASAAMAGCGDGGAGSSTDTAASGSNPVSGSAAGEEASDNGAGGTEEGYSTEIDMEEEPYTVAIQVVTLPGTDYSASEAAREEAINAITVPAINCKIDIQEVWISEVANTTSMGVAGGEKLDILQVGTVTPLSSMVGSDILLDMNQDNLLQNRGQKLIELFGDIMEAGNVGGKQLAIPGKVFNASSKGIFYNKTLADKYGIEIPEKITFEEFSDILYKVHEADPEIMPYYSGEGNLNALQFQRSYESFGQESSYGVVLDSSTDTTVVNLFDTDMFKEYCLEAFHWTQDGIQPGDPTDTNAAQDYFNAQSLFCVNVAINPEQEATWGSNAANAGFEIGAARSRRQAVLGRQTK